MVLGCGRGLKRDLYIGHARGGEDKETPPLRALTKQDPLAAPPALSGTPASGEGTRSPPSDSRSSHTPGIIPYTPSRRPQHNHHPSLASPTETQLAATLSLRPLSLRPPPGILIAHLPRNDSGPTPFLPLDSARPRAHPPTHPGGTPIPVPSASQPDPFLAPSTSNRQCMNHHSGIAPRTACNGHAPQPAHHDALAAARQNAPVSAQMSTTVPPLSALCRLIKEARRSALSGSITPPFPLASRRVTGAPLSTRAHHSTQKPIVISLRFL